MANQKDGPKSRRNNGTKTTRKGPTNAPVSLPIAWAVSKPMALHLKLKKGALHRDLGIKKGKKIPLARERAAAHSKNPKLRKRAQFALNARKWKH